MDRLELVESHVLVQTLLSLFHVGGYVVFENRVILEDVEELKEVSWVFSSQGWLHFCKYWQLTIRFLHLVRVRLTVLAHHFLSDLLFLLYMDHVALASFVVLLKLPVDHRFKKVLVSGFFFL